MGWSPSKRISTAFPSSESFVGGAGDLFRGCYGALDPHKRSNSQHGLLLQRCLPPEYWRGKTMVRLIKVGLIYPPIED